MLLKIISGDLANHRPPITATQSDIPGLDDGFGDTATDKSDTDPGYPKSLFLLQPLFTAYELNAVSSSAQSAVPIPEGLDLDRDIVPGGGWLDVHDDLDIESEEEQDEVDLGQGGGEGMNELRRVIREQKGKKGKGKKRDMGREEVTGETKEEREKVSYPYLYSERNPIDGKANR